MGVFLQACAVLLFSFYVSPDDIESGSILISRPCPYLESTNTPCRGCGVTRAIASMGSFEWVRAWNYNPLGVFIFVMECFLLMLTTKRWKRYIAF